MSQQYTIRVLGTPYTVRTDSPQEEVEQAAAAVEGAMQTLLDKNPRASVTMSAIYAAIQFADDKRRAEESAAHLRGQLKGYLD
ncbi:MAG: cell division protein ZapA, partial [Clostridia bacterium]|nr:cell division protein ZapA [Clostridia bacterium]